MTEEQIQIEFVNWVHRTYLVQWPKLHHSPNGGFRSKSSGQRFKLMGVRPGFPDLVLYERRGKYCGLAIELKTETGRVTPEQLAWKTRLTDCGFDCYIARGLADAKAIFEGYMMLEAK